MIAARPERSGGGSWLRPPWPPLTPYPFPELTSTMVKLLQQILRWLFMRVENVFNVAFGDKLNPFYHLGTISFWQFWLLVGSGLYLYIFADTGVHDAFDSVERITHNQWWAGGILRSIHRYATDGMILTMLLHMLRHFAYDRYRGFRSFSWLTGVALLWLVYIAGVNGFMLVWDKLAQFVVIATAEWFDILPMFNGTLIRNFLYLESVNSRLFTLLAFIHIGVPLIVAFIMWVHVQRVPRAHINPPRPIAIAVTLMFLALALVKPILSQGGEADMSVVPTEHRLRLVRVAGAGAGLRHQSDCTSGTGCSVSPPCFSCCPGYHRSAWARQGHRPRSPSTPTTRRSAHALAKRCSTPACARTSTCPTNAATAAVAYASARCCRARSIPASTSRARCPPPNWRRARSCCAAPAPSKTSRSSTRRAQRRKGFREYSARVVGMEKLTDDVMRVLLKLPEGQQIAFKAGQYINIILEDGQRRAFSFANPPHEAEFVELQIRLMPGGRFTTHVFE
jgi:CDP-4-dehydro-6-deoxyglucose reductase